jgi:hypothetical protein
MEVLSTIADNSKTQHFMIGMLCCLRTPDVDWQWDLGVLCYGDLLDCRLFNIELYAIVI